MADWAPIITAVATAISTIGGAIAFVWNKIEKRFALIEGELKKCREREDSSQEHRGVLITVIELLWQEVQRNTPASPVLVRGKRLLDGLKETSVTAELEAKAERLDRAIERDRLK